MNGCAPGLALIERLKATRKWAILVSRHGMAPHVNESCKEMRRLIFEVDLK